MVWGFDLRGKGRKERGLRVTAGGGGRWSEGVRVVGTLSLCSRRISLVAASLPCFSHKVNEIFGVRNRHPPPPSIFLWIL